MVSTASPSATSSQTWESTAQDNKDSFPLEAEVVERNFYMDDLFKSVPSLLDALQPSSWISEFTFTRWIQTDQVDIKWQTFA